MDFDKLDWPALAMRDIELRGRGEGMSSKSISEVLATGREDPLAFLRVGVEGMRALDRCRSGAITHVS